MFLRLMFMFCLVTCVTACYKKQGAETFDVQFDRATAYLEEKAESAYRGDDHEQAIELYTELIQRDSTKGQYYYRRGVSLFQVEQDSLAIVDHFMALDNEYDEFECYNGIALISMVNNKDSLAILYFEKCLEINPNDKDVQTFLRGLREAPQLPKGINIDI